MFFPVSIPFPTIFPQDLFPCPAVNYNLICVKSVCTLWKRPLIDEKMLRAAVEAKTRILATLLLGSNCVFLGFSGSPSLSLQLPFPLKVNSRRPLQKRSGGKKRECWVIPNCSHLKTRGDVRLQSGASSWSHRFSFLFGAEQIFF